MKRLHAVLFSFLMITMSMAGCFGDDDDSDDDKPDDTTAEALDDWQVHFATTAADLPTCDSDTNGRLYYVDANSEFQVCTNSGWQVIDVSGPAGQDGADGTDGADGADGQDGADGAQGPAGQDGANGADGTDGEDGISTLIRILSSTTCSTGGDSFEIGADNNGDGVLDVTEVIVTVDICNGAPGPQGPAGQDGADGADGTNGTDGADGSQGPAGQDGADGADGTNGTDGADGADGNTTLTVITTLSSSSSNCGGDGGVQIDVGVDDNKNGVLDSNEIDDTTYICNGGDGVNGQDGADGTNGTDGADGQDGADGTNGSASPNTMLTSISSPPATMGCDAGGRVMQQGLDNGDGGGTAQNGILEAGEVDYTTTYCSKYVVWMVVDIRSGSSGSSPGYYMEILVGDTIYFDAYDGIDHRELWAQDTSNHSTWLVADINDPLVGLGSSNPGALMSILVGDTLYFSAYDGIDGMELWAHDTSNHSTWQVADINSGNAASHSNPGYYMEILVGDTIYFDAYDGNDGIELWAHDTSNHSTWQVADINSGSSDSSPGQYMAILVGDTLYFSADDGNDGKELWAHDTSNHSTWQVADINSGNAASHSDSGQ
ncbi:MAG: hypothetical protein QGI21_02545, partial [Candidatus Poseidoniaceae archaeon]|nr:hypothetical protein [Candidatus Poseidoniaceae archaeon]